MKNKSVFLSVAMAMLSAQANASSANHEAVSDGAIAEQRANLSENTQGKGFGPQAPRDLDSLKGTNARLFSDAPDSTAMNLCNIHFHKNAEHKGVSLLNTLAMVMARAFKVVSNTQVS